MKRFISLSLLVASMALAVVACGKKDDGGGGGAAPAAVASTPQPCNNQGQMGANPNCQNYQGMYNQPGQRAWPSGWYWPQNYQPQAQYCGCSFGFQPVQGPFGTACAPAGYFTTYAVVYFNIGYGGQEYWNYPQNTGWYNMPQQAYRPPHTAENGCIQTTAQGCDVRINNCPSGTHCQPVGGGSTIGLCTR